MAWGRRRSRRGGTSCPARAELPAEPENSFALFKRLPSAGWVGKVPDGPGDSRASGLRPVLGAMVSSCLKAGVTTVGRKGPGGQFCEGSQSGSRLRMEQARAVE